MIENASKTLCFYPDVRLRHMLFNTVEVPGRRVVERADAAPHMNNSRSMWRFFAKTSRWIARGRKRRF